MELGTDSAADGAIGSGVKGEDEAADELDSLLNMAEKDVGQLSSVNVAQKSMAPSLQTEVTTVSRQKSTVGRTPAAVFVTTK